MAEQCPGCSFNNPDGSMFCVACGRPLASGAAFSSPSPPFSSNQTSSSGASSSYGYQASQMAYAPGVAGSAAPGQIVPMGTVKSGTDQDTLVSQRAFAGYGVSVMHHSWLLEGDAEKADDMFAAVMNIIHQRNILGLTFTQKDLRERGFQTEERHYFIVQRGVTAVFIYIAPAGRDLYISRATSILPAIDPFRVITLVLLLAVALFVPGIVAGLFSNSYSLVNVGSILSSFFSTFVSLPIWIYLFWLAFRSFRYWLREKDFWVYIRNRDLNDFQMDDIMLLEHATDETVLAAAKQLNLDISKIVPPAQGYRPERRIRVI